MLLKKGKITPELITLLDKWRHTGFIVIAGRRILSRHETSMENLARYIIRASFSQDRMIHHRETGMCTHVPYKGERMVRYYGYYRNAARGKRKKLDIDDNLPYILEPELTDKAFLITVHG